MAAWDYLMVTAANDRQAAEYESQIRMRQEAGDLAAVRHALVLADAGGRRIGSGGSTVQCLLEVLQREGASAQPAEEALRRLRILIVHAGGDSRRLPAYSMCGKIFVPLPDGSTLFDRLVPVFLALPEGAGGAGQVVVAAGDALILFDPGEADFSRPGISVLGAKVAPEEAARHGVLCADGDGAVRIFLQKPSVSEQAEAGAIGADGQTTLDIGVMSLDAAAAGTILRACGSPAVQEIIRSRGLELYREICCALGTGSTFASYLANTRRSHIPEPALAELYGDLRSIPLRVVILRQCAFLHFGSTRQLIESGVELVTRDCGGPPPNGTLWISSKIEGAGRLVAAEAWVEGCRIRAPLTLRGRNVIVGVDIDEPFELPHEGCLDVSPGAGQHFIRYYGLRDSFKDANFRGRPLPDWLGAESQQTLWNARIFPAEKEPQAYRRWRWMLDIDKATSEQKSMLLAADRYSSAEIALRVDHAAFHARRSAIRTISRSPGS
ncbi:MAG: L-fucokinase [Bryobacteraceae bacterium]|jgi:fucokinase